MIGILQNKNLTATFMRKCENEHWLNVKKRLCRSKSCTEADINDDIANLFGAKWTFEKIVKANYKTLMTLKKKWVIAKKKVTLKVDHGGYVKLYERWRKNHGNDLAAKLELTVCPYCNRNHINGVADFDHFFPKDKNYIFALSLYNLIPVCPACNRLKNNQSIDVSSYDNSAKTDDLLTFSYVPESSTIFRPIIIKVPIMSKNIKVLKLDEMYSIHTGLIAEIKYKAMKYNDIYIKFLYNISGFPLKIDLSPKEFYYGNYLSQESYYKRPLSKLTKDLVSEFEK